MRYLAIAALAPILIGAFFMSSDRSELVEFCWDVRDGGTFAWGLC